MSPWSSASAAPSWSKLHCSNNCHWATGQACQCESYDPSGIHHTSHPAQLTPDLVSCLFPQIVLALPCFSISSTTQCFPSESLPAHTPTKHMTYCAYLDGAKHFSKNVFNSGAVRSPQEESHMDKALGRKSAVWLCTDPLSDSRPALFKVFSPRQTEWMTNQLSAGSWVPIHTCTAGQSCAEVAGAAGLSWWPSINSCFPLPLSLIPVPQAACLELAQTSTGSGSHSVQCK